MEDVPHQSIDQAIGKLFGGAQTLSLNRPTRQNRKLTGQSVSNSSCRLLRFHFSGFPDRVRDTSLSFVPRHAAVVGRRASIGGEILDAAKWISRWGNFPRDATVSAAEGSRPPERLRPKKLRPPPARSGAGGKRKVCRTTTSTRLCVHLSEWRTPWK